MLGGAWTTAAESQDTRTFLKSLGFPEVRVHHSFNHFDFSRPSRRILVIGSMGSGKTEFSARIWRDSEVARKKTGAAALGTRTDGADRRIVFFIRSALDAKRFPDYPPDALPYRGGYVRCGKNIAEIASSFDLERVMAENPEAGTWVIDEASFYEERLAYVVESASRDPGAHLHLSLARAELPPGDLQHHRAASAGHGHGRVPPHRLLRAPRVPPGFLLHLPLLHGGRTGVPRAVLRSPAGDRRRPGGATTRGSRTTAPAATTITTCRARSTPSSSSSRSASRPPAGDAAPLREELALIKDNLEKSRLYRHFRGMYEEIRMNSLRVSCIAEKALLFLFTEQNLVSERPVPPSREGAPDWTSTTCSAACPTAGGPPCWRNCEEGLRLRRGGHALRTHAFLPGCAGKPPAISRVFARVIYVHDTDSGKNSETLGVFLVASDPDGIGKSQRVLRDQ